MNEARRAERFAVALPMNLDSGRAVARNVSAAGIFFETDADFSVGAAIAFSIEFGNAGRPVVMKCRAEVVRIERGGGKTGVGAAITDFKLEHGRAKAGRTE